MGMAIFANLSNDIFPRTAVFILGVCGFLVARYIHKHKKPGEQPLICPMNFNCEAVVHSDYSKMFGVSLEIWGMIYYGFVSVCYFLLIFMPEFLSPLLIAIVMLASLGAFLLSLYLVGLQLFIIKEGCFWCFISAIISVSIFIINIYAYDVVRVMRIFLNLHNGM